MTWKPEVIVAAVDGSDTSIRAATQAAQMARAAGARMVLVTVVRPPEGWWGLEGSPPSPQAFAEAISAGRKEVLDAILERLDLHDLDLGTREEVGDPATMIMAVCDEEGAGLLVIGRRGSGLVERMMMGSVADRLAHNTTCPLLIVP